MNMQAVLKQAQNMQKEMMKVKNLGKKSLEEVILKIKELGFDLKKEEE